MRKSILTCLVYLTLLYQTSACLGTTILITGGAGYIGCATVLHMLHKGYNVVVIDKKLPESSFFAHARKIEDTRQLPAIHFESTKNLTDKVLFIRADYADKRVLNHIFSTCPIEAVIHFAGFMEVNRSVRDPHLFYTNNVAKTLSLLDAMKTHEVKKIIFSSSAAVYGLPTTSNPLLEEANKKPINPYGNTKRMIEVILEDYAQAYHFQAISLRYFNAAGALPDYDIGERHDPETHVIPLLLTAAYTSKPFYIFGTDYNTRDDTCIRDYLHIYDVAEAHYLALRYFDKGDHRFEAFNLGTGQGSTVKELIACAEKVIGCNINVQVAPRRAGDPDYLIADATKAQQLLGWRPTQSSLKHILETAHQFHANVSA